MIMHQMEFDVLDACCGSRMFWFDPSAAGVLFVDNRSETHTLKDKSSKSGYRKLVIAPDLQADFTCLPFESESFHLVVFDPPHLMRNGDRGWLARKYGKLGNGWREDIRLGFAECFRVLRKKGTLIFKWNETDIPISEILSLTQERALFGNKCGRLSKSHWVVFMKAING